MNTYGFLVLCLLVLLVLYFQVKNIKRIIIKEKIETHIRFIYYFIGIGFLVFGFMVISTIYQIGLFIGLAIVFFLTPHMTGLSDRHYYYKSKLTGLAGLAVKEQSYSNVLGYKTYVEDGVLYILFTHDFFTNELKFPLKDKEHIEKILGKIKNE